MTRFSPTSGTTSASVPMAAILTNAGSRLERSVRPHSACTSFNATPTPARFLSGYAAVVPLRVDHRERARQLDVRLVMVGDDEIDAELARPPRRVHAADAAVHRDDEPGALGVQAFERRRLQAVAVAQPFGNEVDDVGAEQLERPAQDDGRGDAVHVVIAVHRNALAPGHRAPGCARPPRACRPGGTGRGGRRATATGSGGRRRDRRGRGSPAAAP